MENEHKRRAHYSGTHPKKYDEKYKELNPEKYSQTINKVISKGMTPAGMHISIMVNEIIDFLNIQPGQIGLDATLGYGGHTKAMLDKLNGKGHIYALDIDPIEIKKVETRLRGLGYNEELLSIHHINFKDIDKIADKKCDFLLADLGVSSMQIDNSSRGFSFKYDGPLDLRLNPNTGVPASIRLMELKRDEIENILIENSDEPYAKHIALKICESKSKGPINTTKELYNIVKEALNFLPKEEKNEIVKKTCQRVMQAIRIEINSEFEVLNEFLAKLPNIMAKGGRMAILTFHSGEDRLVKKAFKEYYNTGVFSDICKDVIRPTNEECYNNPRAKSTKMRWAIKD